MSLNFKKVAPRETMSSLRISGKYIQNPFGTSFSLEFLFEQGNLFLPNRLKKKRQMNIFSLNSMPFQLECFCYSSSSLCFFITMKHPAMYPEIHSTFYLQGTRGHIGNDGTRPVVPVAQGVMLICLESHFK